MMNDLNNCFQLMDNFFQNAVVKIGYTFLQNLGMFPAIRQSAKIQKFRVSEVSKLSLQGSGMAWSLGIFFKNTVCGIS